MVKKGRLIFETEIGRESVKMVKIAAVVVTYNRKKLLLENIKCLLNQTKKELVDIIIIDNASSDGTQDALFKYIKNNTIIYHNTGNNIGGAGGFQYGIRFSAEHHYDYVWLMDDDCMPRMNTVEAFLDVDRKLKQKYGFLSSKVLWKDGSLCRMNVQRKTFMKKVENFIDEYVPIVMASFVSLFIPIKVVYAVGLPIKEFFIWTDDWEYTRRISLRYPCYLANQSIVDHKSASNIGASIADDHIDRLERYDFLYRNDVYLYRREGIKGFLYELFRLLWHTMRVIFKAKDHKCDRIYKIWMGTLVGIKFFPDIEYIKKVT
ncbi:MAG: glycosyltransferase family 2 protein [Megasphaera cerevisiae]|nr:glycosyltransferase family 2 protein [Megasphaera cerevisiae]